MILYIYIKKERNFEKFKWTILGYIKRWRFKKCLYLRIKNNDEEEIKIVENLEKQERRIGIQTASHKTYPNIEDVEYMIQNVWHYTVVESFPD